MTPQPLPLVAYVDTTAVSPVAFREEPAGTAVRRRLDRFPYLLSANLLETELRAAFKAEGERFDAGTIAEINWIFPNRQLDAEMAAILGVADPHAAALVVADRYGELMGLAACDNLCRVIEGAVPCGFPTVHRMTVT